MYTVSKGPSKIVAKTRRGVSQNLDRLETLRDTRKPAGNHYDDISNVPRPVFHSNGNIKKSHYYQQNRNQQDVISPQHEEIIRYIHDSWSIVCNQYEQVSPIPSPCTGPSSPTQPAVVFYNDGERSPVLQNFKPFDLESWWGKRLYNNLTKSL